MAEASLITRASYRLRHGLARARKAGQRRLKVVRSISGRVQRGQKALFFRARESRYGRAILTAASFAGAPLDIRRRRRAAATYLAGRGGASIDPLRGYELVSFPASGEFGPVLDRCRRLFEMKQAHFEAQAAGFESWSPEKQAKFLGRKQSFYRYLLSDDDLRRNPELVEFALSDSTLGAATRYLGIVPYLTRVDLVYSLPHPGENMESQLFHLDHEGLRQVKCFIHLFDVSDAEGPFTFIPADASERVLSDVRRLRNRKGAPHSRRYSDEEVAAVGGDKSLVTVKGPAGTGVAVDTSRCLHLGSRVSPGAFRLVLYLQYCTTREQTNVFDVQRFRHNDVFNLALSHSLEPGRMHIDAPSEMAG
jgi:hypothetical protein